MSSLTPARIVGIAILGSIFVRNIAKPLSDPDLWWHLKTGELIVADRALPSVDPFSYTAAGQPWVVQEWLSEVFLHALHQAFGLYGILFYKGLALLALYILVARMITRRAGSTMSAWVLIAITAYAGASNWTERPNLLSFFLFASTFWLIEQRDRRIWLFLPIAATWANLHGMVILGIGLIALVAMVEWLKVALAWEGHDRTWARTLSLIGIGGLVASFLNPYGPGLHAHAFRLLDIVRELVTEWASPNFHAIGPLLFLVLLLVTITVLALTDRRPDPTDLALVLAFTFMALQAARNLAVAAIVIGVTCAKYLPGAVAQLPTRQRKEVEGSSLLNAAGLTMAIAGLGIVLIAGFPRSDAPSDIVDDEMYPLTAIERVGVPGVRVFAKDFWAPLVIFRHAPDVRVFVDLRWDFYGLEHGQRYRDVIAAQGTARRYLDESCTTHVLVKPTDPIVELLRLTGDWVEVAQDDLSVIFARREPAAGCENHPIPALPPVAHSADV